MADNNLLVPLASVSSALGASILTSLFGFWKERWASKDKREAEHRNRTLEKLERATALSYEMLRFTQDFEHYSANPEGNADVDPKQLHRQYHARRSELMCIVRLYDPALLDVTLTFVTCCIDAHSDAWDDVETPPGDEQRRVENGEAVIKTHGEFMSEVVERFAQHRK